jgi:carbonic anhydrase/acetyltransferase-like protein (isoleucine patch superfamily)
MLIKFKDKVPQIDQSVYIAEGTKIIGDVTIGAEASVWFNCVLRGDIDYIQIGQRTNIQDGTIIHLDHGFPCIVGDDITIGHRTIIHGCAIGNGAMISMGATILTGARIGKNAIVGAGAVILEGQEIPQGCVAVGIPARIKREVTEVDINRISKGKDEYIRLAKLAKQNHDRK